MMVWRLLYFASDLLLTMHGNVACRVMSHKYEDGCSIDCLHPSLYDRFSHHHSTLDLLYLAMTPQKCEH